MIVSRLARALWAPVAVVVAHTALAGLIGHRVELDPGFHFMGGLAGAYCLASLWRSFPRAIRLPGWLTPGVAIIAITLCAALLWELGELASDLRYGTHIQESPVDTVADIALGTLGAVIGARLFLRKPPRLHH